MRTIAGLVSAVVLVSVGFDEPANADPESQASEANPAPEKTVKEQLEEVWNRDLFTGDWEGWRTDLRDHGIDAQFRLAQYGQSVASGGVDKNTEYGGTMDYRVNTDLKKLFGLWDGLSVSLHARTRWGQDVNQDSGIFTLPNTGLLMPLPGSYSGSDLTLATLNQTFPLFAGRLGYLSAGKFDDIDLVTGFFPWIDYGQSGFWNVNSLVSALPWFGAVNGLAVYGFEAATINEEFGMGETGFLAVGTENVSTNWDSLKNSFEDGVWMAGFHRFFWKLDDKPGFFMVFAAGSTRDQASNDPRDFTVIPGQGIESTKEDKPWDVALYVYQVFWQAEGNADRKATIFIGGTVGPDDPQFAQYNFFATIEAFGPVASRANDRMGVSYWKNWLTDDFKDLVSPVVGLRDLWGFELYYNVEINKWLHLTPDLQFVKNERQGDDLAVIPGIRLVMDF